MTKLLCVLSQRDNTGLCVNPEDANGAALEDALSEVAVRKQRSAEPDERNCWTILGKSTTLLFTTSASGCIKAPQRIGQSHRHLYNTPLVNFNTNCYSYKHWFSDSQAHGKSFIRTNQHQPQALCLLQPAHQLRPRLILRQAHPHKPFICFNQYTLHKPFIHSNHTPHRLRELHATRMRGMQRAKTAVLWLETHCLPAFQ